MTSPDGKIVVCCHEIDGNQTISIDYGHFEKIVTIPAFGLNMENDNHIFHVESLSAVKSFTEDYDMIGGKRKHCHNQGKEASFVLKNNQGIVINMTFRVFNNGVAFHYELPEGTMIKGEQTVYRFAPSTKRWLQRYEKSYEDFYSIVEANTKGIWGYPALFQTADSVWMLLSEANIERGRCASFLNNEKQADEYKVSWGSDMIMAENNFSTPWRVISIGSLAEIVASTLITDLSEACKIEDTSWIKPGVASWIYWAYNHGSKDYQLICKYVDMAQELHLPYVLIDWEWENMGNGGNIHDAVNYALSKGVKPLLWYNSFTAWTGEYAPGKPYLLNHADTREETFEKLEKMGVAGIKVDFFDGDNTAAMNYYIDLLESAAKYHLLVNFHGATIPRGWQRTYPNLVSTEAVYGAEWYNNRPVLTNKAAAHNATLPFTRNVVGSMDYTPCTFTDSQHPHITTDAHELALTVLFESMMQHLADRPEAYLSQALPVREFFSKLPTTWDDTKLLAGYPGEYVILARRKNETWYVAGINGKNEPQILHVNPHILSGTLHHLQLFKDSDKQHGINIVNITANHTPIEIPCLPNGGFLLICR